MKEIGSFKGSLTDNTNANFQTQKNRTELAPSPDVEAQLEDDLQRELNQAFGRSHAT